MPRRPKRVAMWGILVLLVLLASGELFCRYYLGLGDPPLSRTDPEIEYLFVGPRVYHRFGNTIEYNAFGMRTHDFDARRKNPDELRIMVCGDSVINGGVLTDQSDIATSMMERRLKEQFKRPAVVMNVSAGSWGPPNYWAYVKRYGIFESNALVIVVSSHDFADSPTWEPVVGVSPDFPDKTPTFALEEAITRYLPRYLAHFDSPVHPISNAEMFPIVTQGEIDQSLIAFRDLIHFAQDRQIPVVVAQHFEQTEYHQPEWEGHADFRKVSEELHVPRVELSEPFDAAMKAGKNPYRDTIHPNSLGQKIIADAIYPALVDVLKESGAVK